MDGPLMLPYILTILKGCVAVWTVWALATVLPDWISRARESQPEPSEGAQTLSH